MSDPTKSLLASVAFSPALASAVSERRSAWFEAKRVAGYREGTMKELFALGLLAVMTSVAQTQSQPAVARNAIACGTSPEALTRMRPAFPDKDVEKWTSAEFKRAADAAVENTSFVLGKGQQVTPIEKTATRVKLQWGDRAPCFVTRSDYDRFIK